MGLVRPTDTSNVVPATVAAIDQLDKLTTMLQVAFGGGVTVLYPFSFSILCDSSTGTGGTTVTFSNLAQLRKPDGTYLTPSAVLGQVGSPASGTQRNIGVNVFAITAGGFSAVLWTPSAAPSVSYTVYFLVVA